MSLPKPYYRPELGHLIRTARKEKRITQQKLAILCGVTQQTVSAWDNGALPHLKHVKTIQDALEIDISAELKKQFDVALPSEPDWRSKYEQAEHELNVMRARYNELARAVRGEA
jgi:transcriptional regulator with XRE-family HTH domain